MRIALVMIYSREDIISIREKASIHPTRVTITPSTSSSPPHTQKKRPKVKGAIS
jgi:hypothetical protein